jgi:protein-tyrosine phosphatase
LEGFIDTHNHILPGLDDGPATVDGAVDVARVALEHGITHIVTTPHHNDFHHEPVSVVKAAFNAVVEALKAARVPVTLYPGMELRIDPDLPAQLKDGRALPLANSKYILLEFPFDGIPFFAEDIIFQLRLDDWVPILAHCERIYDIQQKPRRIEKYIAIGCMVQVNSNSISGELGRQSRDVALELLNLGFVDIIASDAHSATRRIPDFTAALAIVTKIIGFEAARRLVKETPAEILK